MMSNSCKQLPARAAMTSVNTIPGITPVLRYFLSGGESALPLLGLSLTHQFENVLLSWKAAKLAVIRIPGILVARKTEWGFLDALIRNSHFARLILHSCKMDTRSCYTLC